MRDDDVSLHVNLLVLAPPKTSQYHYGYRFNYKRTLRTDRACVYIEQLYGTQIVFFRRVGGGSRIIVVAIEKADLFLNHLSLMAHNHHRINDCKHCRKD